MVNSGVINWPFDLKIVKRFSFKKFLMMCDACDIAKILKGGFQGKLMTNKTVGSVWQMDISDKWASLSLHGNSLTFGFIRWKSRTIFLYFGKSSDMFAQTNDLLKFEI